MASRVTTSSSRISRYTRSKGKKRISRNAWISIGKIIIERQVKGKEFEELGTEEEARGEDRNKEISEIKKELKEIKKYILQEVRDIKKERKRYQEAEEE